MKMTNPWFVLLLIFIGWMGFSGSALAKTNGETMECAVKVLESSATFTGPLANRFEQARHRNAGTELTMPDGSKVLTTADKPSPWTNCTGPTPLEAANAEILRLKGENTRLERLAYHYVADGSGRQIRVTWKSTATARGTALEAAKATVAKDALTLKAARGADIWQNIFIGLFLLAFLVAAFRNNINRQLETWADNIDRWIEKREAAKARKNARTAPVAAPVGTGDDDGNAFS